MVYENDSDEKSKWASRPMTFSFRGVSKLKEVQLLVLVATLVQTASYINIDEDRPSLNPKI